MTTLKFKKLDSLAITPKFATDGAAAFDVSYLPGQHIVMSPQLGAPVTLRTGLAFEVPEGHVLLAFSRSGQGFNQNIRLANCVGVIDSDYRGELKVKLTRDMGPEQSFDHISPGDRIAQCILMPIPKVQLEEVTELSSTVRGENGFGSTGVK